MKNVFLILGYNNTRINDVKDLREKANHFFSASLILCKPNPNLKDYEAADDVIDVGLASTSENIGKVIQKISQKEMKIIGILPFSDQGTQLGASLAKELNLPGGNPDLIAAALNKYEFRQNERKNKLLPEFYHSIKSEKISSINELSNFFEKNNSNVFVKPMQEGNSRGCTIVKDKNDIPRAWQQVLIYASGGIIAEENITNASEYSFDHIAGYSWITEKETTQNEYRSEIQQIVPYSESDNLEKFKKAGEIAAQLSGSNNGACHNEFFWMKDENKVAIVEPNLRPAGMKIWNLASLAFENFDPWINWLSWSSGKENSKPKQLQRKFFAGIRMIEFPKDGKITKLPNSRLLLKSLQNIYPEVVDIKWDKNEGDLGRKVPVDNSDFVGHIIAKSIDVKNLKAVLKNACKISSDSVVMQ
jgi:predicted RNA-binding protein YlxR (DUF448 family)